MNKKTINDVIRYRNYLNRCTIYMYSNVPGAKTHIRLTEKQWDKLCLLIGNLSGDNLQ